MAEIQEPLSFAAFEDFLFKYYIPLDHEFEETMYFYDILPMMCFEVKNRKWTKHHMIAIPDDKTGYKKDMFFDQLDRDYKNHMHMELVEQIYREKDRVELVPEWTYYKLLQRVKQVSLVRTYQFRFIFTVKNNIPIHAILIIDDNQYAVKPEKFEVLALSPDDMVVISPIVDSNQTMKHELERMARLVFQWTGPDHFNDICDDEPSEPELDRTPEMEMLEDKLEKESEYQRIEKKPKRIWKCYRNKTDKLVIKGSLSKELYEFCKQQGYQFQVN